MTTIIAVIFTVVATYAAGIIALYVGHRMSHIPFHLDVFDVVFFAPLANVLWFLIIICRLCHWTNDDIVGDDPYNQKMIQIKIERLLSMYDNMLKA